MTKISVWLGSVKGYFSNRALSEAKDSADGEGEFTCLELHSRGVDLQRKGMCLKEIVLDTMVAV